MYNNVQEEYFLYGILAKHTSLQTGGKYHNGELGAAASNLGSMPLRFTARLSMIGLFHTIHMSSTLSISHSMYNEWLEKVEMGIWALKWSP